MNCKHHLVPNCKLSSHQYNHYENEFHNVQNREIKKPLLVVILTVLLKCTYITCNSATVRVLLAEQCWNAEDLLISKIIFNIFINTFCANNFSANVVIKSHTSLLLINTWLLVSTWLTKIKDKDFCINKCSHRLAAMSCKKVPNTNMGDTLSVTIPSSYLLISWTQIYCTCNYVRWSLHN